ncbi:MAG: hypothetical protein ACI37O_07690 [Candidatus Avelusimicrobium sp.]|uniref:hypothetical protein n=1 Tax=Candidatus Avelusimicrobium sp. TaxID=3048833 RepID=UPI003F119462
MGFNKSVQFRAQPRFAQSVTFKQSASGSGAAIQFVEQLPENGRERYIYALVRKHQVASPNKTPTVSFYIYEQGQYYAVSDPRMQLINGEAIVNEKNAEEAYWTCVGKKNEAVAALKELEEAENPNQEEISAAQQVVAQYEAQRVQLLQQLNSSKTLADAARQEAKARDNNQ